MLQQDQPDDFFIATGETHSLEDFIAMKFSHVGLDWRDHTDVDSTQFRATDISESHGNTAHALAKLGWRAKTRLPALVGKLIAAETV